MQVIYDGGCGICQRFKRVVERFDGSERLEWVPFQDADYDAVPVTEEDCIAAMQVVDGERVFSGFYAVRRICRVLPLLWPIYLLLSLPGVPFIGTRVYASVAAHRHCVAPLE